MINKIILKNLFGRFNYEICFKSDGVTIITGPNGYGKSTILKCIEALSEGNMYYFLKLDFEKVDFCFAIVEKNITITKNEKEIFFNNIKFSKDKLIQSSINMGYRRRPYITRIAQDKWLDRRTGEVIDIQEYALNQAFDDNAEQLSLNDIDSELPKKFREIAIMLRQAVGKIYYIKDQRLIMQKKVGKSEQEIVNVIEELPNKFKSLISNISNNYSATANKLDSSYPNRLFNMESGISEEEYREIMIEMNNKFEKLRKYNISEMQNSANVVFKDEHAKALKIYFDDFNVKYKVYEDFITKLDLFTDIVNDRLSFKEIKISRENGIIVVNKEDEHRMLSLSQLSSGEKQEIVLFYELIFETTNDILLLIDEPEISLHIVWQKMFMDDLLKIVEYKGFKVIVATHSPQIINNHWDMQIDLGVLYGNELNKI